MKIKLLSWLLLLSITSNGQTPPPSTKKLLTTNYAGEYKYGTNIEKERIGIVTIYPETDSTVLFYLESNRGAPSYNSGAIYGRVNIKNDSGIFFMIFDVAIEGCKLKFDFTKKRLTIHTIDPDDECGFGFDVFADGVFKRKSKKQVNHFVDREGNTICFATTKPEDYN